MYKLTIPCKHEVTIRLVERDVCSHDINSVIILCKATESREYQDIDIDPDNTATTYTASTSTSRSIQTCLGLEIGITKIFSLTIGSQLCGTYERGQEQCGSTQVQESQSRYTLIFGIVESSSPQWSVGNHTINITKPMSQGLYVASINHHMEMRLLAIHLDFYNVRSPIGYPWIPCRCLCRNWHGPVFLLCNK